MKRIHKNISYGIFLIATLAAYLFEAQMTDITVRNIVTFFSIAFGFYITCISILYGTSYTEELYQRIDEEGQKRLIDTLKDYLLVIGYWSLFSITSVILFTIFATKSDAGFLVTNFTPFTISFLKIEIDLNLLLTSILFGISALNIFYMLLLLRHVIYGMIAEAKKRISDKE